MTDKPNFYSIGKTVQKLKSQFSDISISKIRYLEDEGLVKPLRSKSGYRQFTDEHIERLRVILTLQSDFFLPLHIIKEKLDAMDRGETLKELKGKRTGRKAMSLKSNKANISVSEARKKVQLTKKEIEELNEYHLVDLTSTDGGQAINALDVEVIEIIKALAKYGIEARHLSMFENFAGREALLFYQVAAPLAKKDLKKGEIMVNDLAKLAQQLNNVLLKKSLLEQFSK